MICAASLCLSTYLFRNWSLKFCEHIFFQVFSGFQSDLKMSSGALFPSLVSGSRGSSSKYLVEFRAGKMSLKGNVVTPDKRKGMVYIQQSDDSLIHFCWKDRTTGNIEDVSSKLITINVVLLKPSGAFPFLSSL